MRRKGWVILLLIWGGLTTSPGQELKTIAADFHFDKLPGGPELARGTVLEILEDHQGMIWIGTGNGLARYDGSQYKWFRNNPLDSTSLYHNWVKAVILDQKEDVLWLGTNAGLSRFDIRTETFQNLFQLLDSATVISPSPVLQLSQDPGGRIWIGTIADGLLCFDPAGRSLRRYRHQPGNSNSLSADFVTTTFQDRTGRIWINTNNGIDILDPVTNRFDHIDARKALADANGRVWVFSQNLLRCFDPETEQWTHSPDTEVLAAYIAPLQPFFVDNRPRLWIDDNNNLWAAEDQTLIRYQLDRRQLAVYDKKDPIFQSSIWSLYYDTQQSTWLGTMGGGYYRMDALEKKFNHYRITRKEGEQLRNIAGDPTGGFWVALDGLFHFDPVTGDLEPPSVDHPEFQQLSRYNVHCFLPDRRGNLWIGTIWGGLFKFHPETRQFSHFDRLGVNEVNQVEHVWILDLLEDRQGQLWIADNNNIHVYRPETDSLLTLSHFANCLWEDRQGMIWAGSRDGLVLRIHPRNLEVEKFQLPDSRVSEFKDLLTGPGGRVWLVGEENGLMCFDPEEGISTLRQWREYNSDMPTDLLYTLVADENDQLWIGAEYGLIRFDPRIEQVTGFYTEEETGIAAALLGSWKDDRGALYFGSPSGLLTFHPDSITVNPYAPNVALTDLLLFNRSAPVEGSFGDTLEFESPLSRTIRFTDRIELLHWQNDIAFEFAALNYSSPRKNQYAYRLEGYDKDWNYTSSDQRIAHYTNLDPGSYRFRVKAANNDGIWNDQGATVSLSISPPWWASWWAYPLYLLFFFTGIFAFYRFQLSRQLALAEKERLAELDSVKSRLYSNITHEFRTPLTIILGITDLIKTQVSEQVKENLQIVRRNGRGLLKLVNQMLDLSRLESGRLQLNLIQGDVINYLQYLTESFHSLAKGGEVDLQFQSEPEALSMDYDPERLMHVISNLLSNAIKFTPPNGNVHLKVSHRKEVGNEEMLRLTLSDTGTGIPADDLPHIFDRFYQAAGSSPRAVGGAGIGLALTKELLQLMGGTIDVTSTLGEGTTFTVTLPVRRTAKLVDKISRTGAENDSPFRIEVHERPVNHQQRVPATGVRPRLLFIEDHPDLVRYFVSCFEPAYHLEIATNGREGIDKAVSIIPDLIVTDIMMPEKDGFEVCETLKDHELTSHIPIIMLTAKVDVDSRLSGLRRGADAYLSKPFLREELEVRIKALLEQRQKLQAYYRAAAGISEEKNVLSPPREETTMENGFLEKINRIIEQNLENEHFTVEQLGKEAHVSSASLYRKLTAITGISSSRYIRSFRLAKAKGLLKSTTKPVASVAFETGFKDPDYFSRIFKKELGQTPTQFRLSLKHSDEKDPE